MFALLLLAIEIITPGVFFFACLGLGALLAGLAALLGAGSGVSWMVFFGASTALILTVAPLVRRIMKRQNTEPVGLDALKGQQALVIEALDPLSGQGQVRLTNGAIWRVSTEEAAPAGASVEVVDIVGTRLKVRPSQKPIL